jgi:hypothetical protein
MLQGGETRARERLQQYLWGSDCVAEYFETRNGMLGADYSTKFSPWLAAGCISPREIYHEIRKYEAQRTENKSTYWVIFELIWRDFFRFFAVKHGSRIFFEYGITGQAIEWNSDVEVRSLSVPCSCMCGLICGKVQRCLLLQRQIVSIGLRAYLTLCAPMRIQFQHLHQEYAIPNNRASNTRPHKTPQKVERFRAMP